MEIEGFDGEYTALEAGTALLGNPNFELQLAAVRDLLALTSKADGELSRRINEIDRLAKSAEGELYPGYTLNEHYVELYGEHFYASVYQDTAHSMAALGCLAPFTESLFCQGLKRVGSELNSGDGALPNSDRAEGAHNQFWDCHYFHNGKTWQKDIVKGILQLSGACGLSQHLPPDSSKILEALFAYRNKVFHLGFEWPEHERENFAKRCGHDWPKDWFDNAESAHRPWVFYMTPKFLDLLLERVGQWVEAFGQLYLEYLEQLHSDREAASTNSL